MAKKLVITGTSAMQAWDEGVGAYARPTRVRSSAQFATTAAELAEFTTLPQGCTQPVEILVGDAANRTRTARWHANLRQSPLPAGELYDIGGDRLLTSPGLFFLQTAPKLTFVQAVLLGMELCGYHSTLMSAPYRAYCDEVRCEQGALLTNPWPPTEWDMSLDHQRELMELGFVIRAPLTDAGSLFEFAQRIYAEHSRSRAVAAARYVAGKSRSPMESRLYIRYCLPRRYGSLGLVPVELNREFKLSAEIAQATGITDYSVDLYWPKGGIAIEYQGKQVHAGLSAEEKDRLKRNILETTGVRIISIDSTQFANEDVLSLYGNEIAKSMGIAAWKLKPRKGEQAKRNALSDELRMWDADLYRPKAGARR